VAPPWREGILQTNGIPINWEIPGEGNVLVPKLNERDEDLARVIRGDPQTLSRLKKGNYDRNLCAKVGQAYLDIFLDISRRVGKPEEILRLIAPYEATSVRLSRPLETRITSAEYLRQWNAAIAAKEAVPSANKGSPRRCLETIFRSNLKYKNDISVKDDLLPKRSKTFDATYSIDTVREEVRILKALGILEEGFLPNTYRLRSQIRDLSPPDMERVLSISDLDRYTIPESEIPAVRERIEMIVPNPLIDPKDNSFNISISLGGTKVGVGAVNTKGEVLSTGDSIEWRNIYGDNAKSRDIVNAIMRQILSLLKVGTLHEKNMQGVGIAFAGPIDEEAGIVGTPFKAPNLPFDHYPLKEELEKILKKRFGRLITVTMYNDSKAALLGEMSPKGLLSGKTSGGIMILGTGVNITVAKNGAAYFGEKGEIKELGHNLVASLGADGLWHYRCTSLETLGDHPKFAPGEMDFEDRNGGPNLDKRFKEASGGKFGIKEITSAARKGDALAIKLIKETGAEIGRGIAAFQYAYRNEPFINDIVLVSSVSEKLGLGIPDDLGRDLLFGSIQDAAIEELVLMGMDRSDAEKAGRGIDRSHMTYERELVAFTPIAPDMFAGSSMRDMETIHDMNMSLLPPVETGKILYHVIPKSIVPQTIMGEFGKLARWTKNYRERIVVVDDKDFIDTVAKLSDDKNNKVLAAVPKEDMLAGLRSGVKALVFRSDTEGVYGFRQLEGVIAALRALERSDASALTRIYRILTGSDFSGAEKDILDNIGDPRGLAKFMIFNLKPVPVNYKELPVLNRRLLEFIRSA
jgi:predicted NBD/HSP70 family sugar kinase